MRLGLTSIMTRHTRYLTSLIRPLAGRHTRSRSTPIQLPFHWDGSSHAATVLQVPTQNGLRFFIVLILPVSVFTSPDFFTLVSALGYSGSTILKSIFSQLQRPHRPRRLQQLHELLQSHARVPRRHLGRLQFLGYHVETGVMTRMNDTPSLLLTLTGRKAARSTGRLREGSC